MTVTRKVGSATSEKRALLLDVTAQIMLEEGYAAVSSRSVAARAGINAPLVHYYFPTLDDLFVAVFQRAADEHLERMAAALVSAEPLRSLWEFSTDSWGTGLMAELLAAANHRKVLKAEVVAMTSRGRRLQIAALDRVLADYGIDAEVFPPALVAAAIQGLAIVVVREQALAAATDHDVASAAIDRFLERLESAERRTELGVARFLERTVERSFNCRLARGAAPMAAIDATAARYVGARVNRVEDERLLTGRGTFVDDVVRPGMLHACFVRSPFARARILGIDASAARALPGVHAVFTAADLNPGVHEHWYTAFGPKSPDTPRPPLAEGEVRFAGDPVALVIAADRYLAEDATEVVDVDYESLQPVVDYVTAQDAPDLVHADYPNNLAGQLGAPLSDESAAVFDGAVHVVRETIYQQGYQAVPMETRGIIAEWSGGDMTIWSATQSPHEVRMFLARVLGLPEHRVRVIIRDTGGAFGQKVMPQREDMCIALAAMRMPAAVKWIEDRRENLMSAGQSRHEHGDARMAFDEEGRILAAHIDHIQDVGAYPTPWPVGTGAAVGMLFPGPYRITRAGFTSTSVFSNTVGRTAYRGPWQFESVAREVLLDIAARRMAMDPVELRRRNLLRSDEMPFANANGMPYSDMTPLETFEHALELLDYKAFRRDQAEARAAGRSIGVGTCTYVEPTTSAQPYYGTEGATIRIEPSGKVNVYVAGGSAGNSLETAVVQLTADALGVDMDDVNTIQGDTALTPFGGGTGGSRSGSMLAGAVGETASILRARIVAIAAHSLEASPDDIEVANGRASVRGTPTAGLSIADIAQIAYFQLHALPPEVPPGLEASARYRAKAPIIWANATHVCTCEVDLVTGQVQILRYIVSEDCGPMINPDVVEGQIAGGTVQGIGGALYEHLVYDEDGNPLTTTFMDYLLPTTTEVPIIEYGHVETPGPGPGGYKGVGEGGAIGAPPAVVNAVADALAPLGVTITQLPLTPAVIVELVHSRRGTT